jgi:hypothetical protein
MNGATGILLTNLIVNTTLTSRKKNATQTGRQRAVGCLDTLKTLH